MRRFTMILAATLAAASLWAVGIPAQITYQGTLKEKGLPAGSGTPVTRTMLFRLTNQDGTQVYWSSGNMAITVSNGLFSAQLAPAGVDWQSITPYIEVSVQGQQLSPREPVSASVYAMMSQSIVDGAVTPNKVAPGYGLVPAGGIMMFDTVCPPGWVRYAALDNRFPMGVDPAISTVGGIGGNSTHSHSISSDGSHIHELASDGTASGSKSGPSNIGWSNSNSALFGFNPGSGSETWSQADRQTTPAGTHNHGGATGDASSLPPYENLVFCKKQ